MLTLLVLILLAGALLALEKTHVINLYTKSPVATPVSGEAVTTSTTPSAQEDFSDGNERQEGNSLNEGEGSGSVEDTRGETTEETDPSSWLTSPSGEITVHNPTTGRTIKNGGEISGTSTLKKVSFRLIDNVSGVIAQGEMQVVNGKFSGVLSYTTGATEGRLDIYGTKSDGQEYSNVEVPIKF